MPQLFLDYYLLFLDIDMIVFLNLFLLLFLCI